MRRISGDKVRTNKASDEANDEHNLIENNITAIDIALPDQEITKCSILKQLLVMVVPYTINGLVITSGGIVTNMIIATLGEDALAATAIIATSELLTIATAKAMLSSTSEVAARNSNDIHSLSAILQQSWAQAVILSLPTIGLLLINKPIFLLLGQKEEIINIANEFLSFYTFSIPGILLLKSNEQFALGMKRPTLGLIFNFFNTFMSALLGYFLFFGKLFFPKYGVKGMALSYSFSWISFLMMTSYFAFDPEFKQYKIYAFNRQPFLKLLFSLGAAGGIQTLLNYAQFFIQTNMIGWLGENSLAAEQIVMQYLGYATSPILSLSAVISTMVGNDISRTNGRNVKSIGNIGLITGTIIALLTLTIFSTCSKILSNVLLKQENENYSTILDMAKYLFIINGINGLFDAAKNICTGALIGFYDVAIPAIIALASLWIVGTPSSFILAFGLNLGVSGVFIGRGIGLVLCAALLLHRWNNSTNNPQAAIQNGQTSLISKINNTYNECNDNIRRSLLAYQCCGRGSEESTADEVQGQVSLLSKFNNIFKNCYNSAQRNYSTIEDRGTTESPSNDDNKPKI